MHQYKSFQKRHIGPNEPETQEMLKVIGASSLGQLIDETIPSSIHLKNPLDLPPPVSEYELMNELRAMAAKNKVFKSYIGMGYYETITPPVILRNIFENPSWYTSYTPYQAEISQGRLESLLNFQTMICDLTALPVANASLLDEGTAAAEAMRMLHDSKTTGKGDVFFVAEDCFPQTKDVLKTRAFSMGITLMTGDPDAFDFNDSVFGVLLQYPSEDGRVRDYTEFCRKAKEKGIRIAVAADLMSLALLKPPGEWGADVAVGSTQRFGIPMGYGGPHAAYFATHDEFKRKIPGRIIGVSVDAYGNRALRMALQTREQHIKREKATSNICTSQVLLANMAAMYAVYHGPEGIREIARHIHDYAQLLEENLSSLGYRQLNPHYFDTLKLRTDTPELARRVVNLSRGHRINLRIMDAQTLGISVNETTEEKDIQELVDLFAKAAGHLAPQVKARHAASLKVPESLRRTSAYLQHPVFNTYHSETELMRYIKSLEMKDISLTHSMISLGSCTMKLNAAAEMLTLTWPEFNALHPFAPADQAKGYYELFDRLSAYFCEITGLAATSLQPNSGAQGEYAGLMVIRAYLDSIGQGHRRVALIPASAHGTNPASAVMAGMEVVVVKCDDKGNIDVPDLRRLAEQHQNDLAALIVTYPSTHGVFEESIVDICQIIHQYGGQVYMDGANMNAQVGLTSPGKIGADVCHLNLHKTFAIPHGGGGPGVGPICVAKHLAPFLPGHPVVKTGGEKAIHAISAAPWGSALVLWISYAYIRLMGAEGLTEASKYAILNANYLKEKLAGHYETLYCGKNGRIAHEMILDTRRFKSSAGIEVEDIAKRLMDYGYHAPTVSFPVPGTMMVEPTESESKAELDRFCEALIAIRQEIAEIERGEADKENNVLRHAPHTAQHVTADEWEHPYSRQKAAYPLDYLKHHKIWPSVGRVNNAYGDRNLVCSCPPIEAYQ